MEQLEHDWKVIYKPAQMLDEFPDAILHEWKVICTSFYMRHCNLIPNSKNLVPAILTR